MLHLKKKLFTLSGFSHLTVFPGAPVALAFNVEPAFEAFISWAVTHLGGEAILQLLEFIFIVSVI